MLGLIEPYKPVVKKPDNINPKKIDLKDYAPVNPNDMSFKQSTLNEHFRKTRNEA